MYQVKVSTARGTHVTDAWITEPSCVIGKGPESGVTLNSWRIGPAHARLALEERGLFVHDLRSRAGTRVNGKRIESYGPLSPDDVIEAHDYDRNKEIRGRKQ